MKKLFDITFEILMFLSRATGFSYKEINIIVWFILIPLSWAFLIDKIYKFNYIKIISIIVISITLLFINDFTVFSNWLFDISADFLKGFDSVGSNYTASSVIICVFIPIAIYFLLIKKAYFFKHHKTEK
ncbi:hypothetical protein [Lacinutrix sp. Bg11-31]|uniref:hypothetical protein n=1 Tax=Lacinutrix sp. Bg11-31 TaxID=2057808 RepID=UPI000C310E80|nr:hypothetical protein [Lacinutrix sp. Bg11-31]AUC81815.1 hypothetical protein CW733_06590 [Lacinutrix sp. Bg11-31]